MERNNEQVKNIWKPLCLVLAALLALSWVFFGFLYSKGGVDFSTLENPEQVQMDSGGAIIGESTGNGVALMSAKIAPEDFAANDISPMAETAYTLTATITPDNATDKSVDWTIEWVKSVGDPTRSSAWADGKTVTDYVTVTPTADGALTANVECLQAFGTQINITVTSRDNSSVSATCTVDYAQRATGLQSFDLRYGLLSDDGSWDEEYTYTFDSSAPADFEFKDLEDKELGDFQFFVEKELSNWKYTVGTGSVEDTYTTTFKVRINPDFVTANSSALSGVEFTDITQANFLPTYDCFYQMLGGLSPSSNSTLYNSCLTNLLAFEGKAFELEVTITGKYSTITQKYKIGGNLSALKTAVNSIDLNTPSVVF